MVTEKKAKSILSDLAIMKLEGPEVSFKTNRNVLAQEHYGRNSHTFRTDTPLITDSKNYKNYLFNLSVKLNRELNEQQYKAVIIYFSHAKMTMTKVSEELNYGRESIGNAVKKAVKIIVDLH